MADSGGKLVERAQIPAEVVKPINKRLAAEERKAAAAKKRKAAAKKDEAAEDRRRRRSNIQNTIQKSLRRKTTCQAEEDQADPAVSVDGGPGGIGGPGGPGGIGARWTRWPRTT